MSDYNEINHVLDGLLFKIIKTQELEIADLKNLLLICYHQLIDDHPDKLTTSFLITILKQIVDIEDYYIFMDRQNQTQWHDDKVDDYLEKLIHPRVKEIYNKGDT